MSGNEESERGDKLILRIRYADLKGAVTKMPFHPSTTVTEAIRIIVGTGFNERTHTQPNHLEAYGLHFPVAKKGRMKKKKEMKKEKAKFRDTRVWLDENHSLSFYSLQDGEELVIAVKYIHLVQAQRVKICIPFFADLEVDFEYDYNTTVADAIESVVTKAKEREKEKRKRGGKEKKDKDKKKKGKGGEEETEEEHQWEVFLPIGREDKTWMGIWMEPSRTLHSYSLYTDCTDAAVRRRVGKQDSRYVIFCHNQADINKFKKKLEEDETELWWMSMLQHNKWQNYAAANSQARFQKLRDRAREGIPGVLRGDIWPILTGANELFQPGLYQQLIAIPPILEVDQRITPDLHRTHPYHPFFQTEEGQQQLRNVLVAYTNKYPELGYCQGTNFIVGILLLTMDEETAFWVFDALMVQYGMHGFFGKDVAFLQTSLIQFDLCLQMLEPEISHMLEDQLIPLSMFAQPWFLTLLSYDTQLSFLRRLWDIFFNEGFSIIFKTAIAMVKDAKDILAAGCMEELLSYLQQTPKHTIRTDVLLNEALKMPTLDIMNKIFTPDELKAHNEGQRDELCENRVENEQTGELEQTGQARDQASYNGVSFASSSSPSVPEDENDGNKANAKATSKRLRRHSEKLAGRKKSIDRMNTNDGIKKVDTKEGKKYDSKNTRDEDEADKKVQFNFVAGSHQSSHESASTSPRSLDRQPTQQTALDRPSDFTKNPPSDWHGSNHSKSPNLGLRLALNNFSGSCAEFLDNIPAELEAELASPKKVRKLIKQDTFKEEPCSSPPDTSVDANAENPSPRRRKSSAKRARSLSHRDRAQKLGSSSTNDEAPESPRKGEKKPDQSTSDIAKENDIENDKNSSKCKNSKNRSGSNSVDTPNGIIAPMSAGVEEETIIDGLVIVEKRRTGGRQGGGIVRGMARGRGGRGGRGEGGGGRIGIEALFIENNDKRHSTDSNQDNAFEENESEEKPGEGRIIEEKGNGKGTEEQADPKQPEPEPEIEPKLEPKHEFEPTLEIQPEPEPEPESKPEPEFESLVEHQQSHEIPEALPLPAQQPQQRLQGVPSLPHQSEASPRPQQPETIQHPPQLQQLQETPPPPQLEAIQQSIQQLEAPQHLPPHPQQSPQKSHPQQQGAPRFNSQNSPRGRSRGQQGPWPTPAQGGPPRGTQGSPQQGRGQARPPSGIHSPQNPQSLQGRGLGIQDSSPSMEGREGDLVRVDSTGLPPIRGLGDNARGQPRGRARPGSARGQMRGRGSAGGRGGRGAGGPAPHVTSRDSIESEGTNERRRLSQEVTIISLTDDDPEPVTTPPTVETTEDTTRAEQPASPAIPALARQPQYEELIQQQILQPQFVSPPAPIQLQSQELNQQPQLQPKLVTKSQIQELIHQPQTQDLFAFPPSLRSVNRSRQLVREQALLVTDKGTLFLGGLRPPAPAPTVSQPHAQEQDREVSRGSLRGRGRGRGVTMPRPQSPGQPHQTSNCPMQEPQHPAQPQQIQQIQQISQTNFPSSASVIPRPSPGPGFITPTTTRKKFYTLDFGSSSSEDEDEDDDDFLEEDDEDEDEEKEVITVQSYRPNTISRTTTVLTFTTSPPPLKPTDTPPESLATPNKPPAVATTEALSNIVHLPNTPPVPQRATSLPTRAPIPATTPVNSTPTKAASAIPFIRQARMSTVSRTLSYRANYLPSHIPHYAPSPQSSAVPSGPLAPPPIIPSVPLPSLPTHPTPPATSSFTLPSLPSSPPPRPRPVAPPPPPLPSLLFIKRDVSNVGDIIDSTKSSKF